MTKLKANRSKSTSEIILSGDLTIGKLTEVKKLFQKTLKKGKDIVVDLHEGEEFDVAFLQLMISLFKSCTAEGLAMSVRSPLPGAFMDCVNSSGSGAYTWLLDNHGTEEIGGENE
ncbi:MAG: STAS domain-containing protein [Bacteroidetes bacterium]|nr:STAS domain-containing protein [Bacteroidota bacterium]